MSHALDSIAPSFRAAKERWPDAPNLEAHYADLARTYEANGSSLLELCKSFVEAVCITLVHEIGGALPDTRSPSTTQLLGAALDALGLRNDRGASPLSKIISSYNKLADGLTEVRDGDGSVAHGKDGFYACLSARSARVYVLTADSIVGLLLDAYDDVEPSILHTRERHDRFERHNRVIDSGSVIDAEIDEEGVLVLRVRAGGQHRDEGIELRAPASELLYNLDRQAYIDVLADLNGVTIAEEAAVDEDVAEEASAEAEMAAGAAHEAAERGGDPGVGVPDVRRLEPIAEYDGQYSKFVSPLYEFITHDLLSGDDSEAGTVLSFVYTLLQEMEVRLAQVDWAQRDSTRSAVRLYIKRLIAVCAIEGTTTDGPDKLIDWLSQHIRGDEGDSA